jgi:hypothetical protein
MLQTEGRAPTVGIPHTRPRRADGARRLSRLQGRAIAAKRVAWTSRLRIVELCHKRLASQRKMRVCRGGRANEGLPHILYSSQEHPATGGGETGWPLNTARSSSAPRSSCPVGTEHAYGGRITGVGTNLHRRVTYWVALPFTSHSSLSAKRLPHGASAARAGGALT